MNSNSPKMPVLFVGHGSPMNAIGENRAREGWRAEAAKQPRPSVIIAVSAHWATDGLYVRRAEDNPQINDMYGFPQEFYEVHYEPSGSMATADRVLELLGGQARVNNDWGIDHGIWSVLATLFPAADVPVVMLSTDIAADPESQFEIGCKLRRLREEGALILASGNVVHNLRMVAWDKEDGYAWADEFDARIRESILGGHFEVPIQFEKLPNAMLAAPTVEHYYPLLVALGAADPTEPIRVWNDYRELGSMSMTSYTFGA